MGEWDENCGDKNVECILKKTFGNGHPYAENTLPKKKLQLKARITTKIPMQLAILQREPAQLSPSPPQRRGFVEIAQRTSQRGDEEIFMGEDFFRHL